MHQPVLLSEVVEAFEGHSLKIFVDGTVGAGGHAAALLGAHPEIERYVAMDQDKQALEIARTRLKPWEDKVHFVLGNFEEMEDHLSKLGISRVQGILLDLGVSSMHLDQAERGFSFMRDGPLDMRMDGSASLTAAEIVNQWPEEELQRLFRDYGEEKQWRLAAHAIVVARKKKAIRTTGELVEVLKPLFSWKKKGVNPLTLIFQALRIAVNRELEVLEKILSQAIDLLEPQGRLAIISFHSLEDRMVKEAFRHAASDKHETSGLGGIFRDKEPTAHVITKKPIIAHEEEIRSNPRSRSAKLRVLEKL